jgi:hypothetical protein
MEEEIRLAAIEGGVEANAETATSITASSGILDRTEY